MARLLHWKGLHLSIKAFAAAQLSSNTEYWILGEGPENLALKALAIELGLGERVRFLGRLPRAETLHHLAQCHVLVHPSLHDSGGWVCLEAMAAGRPVICLDIGGPGVQVTEETGFKVPAHNPEQAIKALATAMEKLADSPELCKQMGTAGKQRVQEHYSWEAKGRELSQQYIELCQESASCVS
jgi:glycosyltransferase involved in cell wall biosynthesis